MTARATDVVVIGAGMSGLVAARALHRSGVDVLALEAADRVGGRMLAETTPLGSRLDLGGQWIGHGHHRFAALAAEVGTRVFAMDTPKQPDFVHAGVRLPAWSRPLLAANLGLLRWELGARRRRAPRGWTRRTVRQWLDARVGSPAARRALDVMYATTTCADADQLTMQTFGELVRYQGGLAGMLKTRGGAQESLVVEAAGTLPERLAEELGPRVVLGQPVVHVDHGTDGVTLRTPDHSFHARRVIVTVPPPMTASITFDPPLPEARTELVRSTYMGAVYKAVAVYERPFWRDRRPHAELILLDEPGAAVFDTSPPDGPGHLCLLVAGSEARGLDTLGSEARQATLLGQLVPHLGDEVTQPVSWHEKAWHLDEHTGGGYAALPRLGTTAGTFPFTSAPVGPIHWAGTETASEHAGYIEGAIEAGERAADEVRRALEVAHA